MSAIMTIDGMTKRFHAKSRPAVDDVSFDVEAGTTFGLVGESGSGKSTLVRCALRLIEPTGGTSTFAGDDVGAMSRSALRVLRKRTGYVFQNPSQALDPRIRIGASIAEPLVTHGAIRGRALHERVRSLLSEVGLDPAMATRFPHELSGGQCQRVGIARALALEPELVVLDEPTSALDVSVQAHVLRLLQRLKEEHGLSYLMISHDLDVVRMMADVTGVMRAGRLIEIGPTAEVLTTPSHEYTQALLDAMPTLPPLPASLDPEVRS